ncbi:WxL domain-containing protein [Candidatus Enterococcus mansonii]|uniref:WxL domain-containing protein n=1 Tax=Candidatus Enterococcus mansonii TaxID=1834181 RepID=A0A242CGN1_9ENTE|nr:WxL domain-containing protein [Enterococcus sp. 4G2_DIV0659]OTO08942.1 hypothetical protein A5880_001942 [Enterococcus sp. 4G2_DIV0659]
MKNSYKLAGAALMAAMGVGLALPSATKAAPGDVIGKGKITFTQDDTTNPTNLPPGESTGPELTEPTQNTEANPLKIVSVTDLDFDSKAIVANDSDKTYDAKAFKTTTTDGTDAVMPHFIRFQDVRADVDTNYHTVSAEMTKQFTNGTRVLDGATIDYKNVSLITGTNATTKPDTTVEGALKPTFNLALNQKETVLSNKQEGKGYGVFELMFGDKDATVANPDSYDSITLNIPGTNVLKTGEYEAEITWSITDAN